MNISRLSNGPLLQSASSYLRNEMETEGSILFRVTPEEIEALSTDRVVALLHPEVRGYQGLSHLMGTITIVLPDTSAHHGEPFLCPQMREFCEKAHDTLPFWGFFFSINSMSLWKMTLCLLRTTQIRQYQRPADTKFWFDGPELEATIGSITSSVRLLGQKAQIPTAILDSREAAVRNYFDRLLAAHCAKAD